MKNFEPELRTKQTHYRSQATMLEEYKQKYETLKHHNHKITDDVQEKANQVEKLQ